MEQPDLAIIDDDLSIMTGLDAARVVRIYAPATPVLLLTSEPDISRQARAEGIATHQPATSDDELLTTIDEMIVGGGPPFLNTPLPG